MYTEVKMPLEMNSSLLVMNSGFEFEKLSPPSFTVIIVTFNNFLNYFLLFYEKGKEV